ncbi:Proteasome activator complex subunit 4 [Holothuria leucospilota]|uniref:Proteasome activator complex subunit 4 n=1 Tax=Holothuria leucospilota TaxID=206669 RepID=A0A9Q1CH07_HOLLE|nr:Proteasome activator complex subunit 4 [Holothuria leucospilota]
MDASLEDPNYQAENKRKIVYNKYLPYAENLEEESRTIFRTIKENLYRSVALRELRPGVLQWTNRLYIYIQIYGRNFSKEEHVALINLYLELVTIPDLNCTLLNRLCSVLAELLKKKSLLSRDDLQIQWRPLYEMMERVLYSPYEGLGLEWMPQSIEGTLQKLIEVARLYFTVESTQEILDEVRPLLCPFDETMYKGITYLKLFLPTLVPPEHHDQGFKLWLKEIMGIWDNHHNSPAWEPMVINLLARTAAGNVGYIDWTDLIPMFFTRFLRSFNLPVGTKKLQIGRSGKGYDCHAACQLIVYMMGPDGVCQRYLEKFFTAIESYFHPSNMGKYTFKLLRILSKLPSLFVERLHRERYSKPYWYQTIPESAKLTDKDITAFVKSIKPVVFLAIYSKIGSIDAAVAMKNLALLRPELVLPSLLDKTYHALETLTEPHQLVATLNCVLAVSRSLLKGGKWFPDGPSHLMPLLQAVLPGIDANDNRKCMVSLQIISTMAMLSPFVDCSQAHLVRDDLTEQERELCSATAGFEDFVLMFMERCFAVVDSTVVEEGSSNNQSRTNLQDSISSYIMGTSFYFVLTQCSPTLYEVALDKLRSYVTSTILETDLAGRTVAGLCREAVKVNPPLALKKLLPHCSQLVLNILSSDEMQEEEHLDKEVLFNLLLLSEIVHFSTHELLNYKELVFEVLEKSLHLTCKEGYQRGCFILKNFLLSMTETYPTDHRSIAEGFDRPLETYLPIRDLAKAGDIDNLQVNWSVPKRESVDVAKETLEKFLYPELKKLEGYTTGTEMTREQLLQSLKIVYSALYGCACLLPLWEGAQIKEVIEDWQVPTSRITLVNSTTPFVSEFSDVREKILEVIHNFLQHILATVEDNTKVLVVVIDIYNTLHRYKGVGKKDIDARRKSHMLQKSTFQDRLHRKKKHVRALLIERVYLQHQIRQGKFSTSPFTELDRVVLKDLLQLSISRYSEVRKKAQEVFFNCQELALNSKKEMLSLILPNLKEDPNIPHHQFKGALYLLVGNGINPLTCARNWEMLRACWLALVNAGHSEKPSITKLIDQAMLKVQKHFCSLALSEEVSMGSLSKANALIQSSPVNESYKMVTSEEETRALGILKKKSEDNVRNYEELANGLVDLLESGKLRWKFSDMASSFLGFLLRKDVQPPIRVVKRLTEDLASETLRTRKMSILTMGGIFKLTKREHKKVVIDPYAIAGCEPPPPGQLSPGDRPDNMWHRYDSSKRLETEEEWNACHFVEKTHWGYYCWPKEMKGYAPEDQQPKLDRAREELTETEKVIFDHFSDEKFVAKVIEYFSLEERKEKDKFCHRRFVMFKGLFRNFGDSVLPVFKPHLEKLADDQQESSQRCLTEIVAGLMRGSKHWGFKKTKELWEFLIPILEKAFSHLCHETVKDWTISLSTACESRDPRKLHWFLEWVIQNPIRGEGGSILDSSRLMVLKGCLCQQEWRIPTIQHQLLAYLENHMDHSYKNVRDCIGSLMMLLLIFDVPMPDNKVTACPRLGEFFGRIYPRVNVLRDSDDWVAQLSNGSGQVKEEKQAAVRLLKTVMRWLREALGTMIRPLPQEIFHFLPLLMPLETCEADEELQNETTLTLACMAQCLLHGDAIVPCIMAFEEIADGKSWRAKCSMLTYLQVMVFNNLFLVGKEPQMVRRVQELVEKLLKDERLEVRETAGVTLSGLLHCQFIPIESKVRGHFEKLCKTALPNKSKKLRLLPVDGAFNDAIVQRHAGILGLSACVQAFPYDVPDWMPQILMDLTDHLHDPQPIEMTVRKTLSDFRRTHHDNWHEHKQQFTDDQLVVLTDLLVSPCYYA